MPIAFNAVTATTGYTQSTGVSLAHTTAGSDRALVVVVQPGGTNVDTNFTSIAVTYNGVSMTGNSGADIFNTQRKTVVFALLNPALGANNVVTTWSGGGTEIRIFALSYTGVHQTTGIDAWGENSTTSGTSLAVTGSTTTGNAWLVGGIFLREGGLGNVTLSAGTVRSQDQTSAVGDNGPLSTGSNNMTWGFASGAAGSGTTAAWVALAPSATTITSNAMFMGANF